MDHCWLAFLVRDDGVKVLIQFWFVKRCDELETLKLTLWRRLMQSHRWFNRSKVNLQYFQRLLVTIVANSIRSCSLWQLSAGWSPVSAEGTFRTLSVFSITPAIKGENLHWVVSLSQVCVLFTLPNAARNFITFQIELSFDQPFTISQLVSKSFVENRLFTDRRVTHYWISSDDPVTAQWESAKTLLGKW